MGSRTYFAVQGKQMGGMGRVLVPAPPILHEFTSAKARNEWVARRNKQRRIVTAKEAAVLAARPFGRAASPVRHSV